MNAVEYSYYTGSFGGTLLTAEDWATLQPRAQNAVDVATRFSLFDATGDDLPALEVRCYSFAVCLQAEYLMYEGTEVSVAGSAVNSFTVGKVSVTRGNGADASAAGSGLLCVAARAQLEAAGLMSRDLAVLQEPFVPFPLGLGVL